ncbi:hypothetical protein [Paenibacillus tyrfis]|uniref:hypothetical protein n=1 Tax=Paenibacillus tyrfis TaxID=1501230 RepID=UPI0020A14A7E|nr:hypothetical protein [Paenibacillus tyrfis]MCP1312688.1 hypothetical protein [Paenibacillus tyrfis]
MVQTQMLGEEIEIEELFSEWELEYQIGPVLLKIKGETSPVKIEATGYYMGRKLGTIVLDETNRSLCLKGKIDDNNKVEACLTLLEGNKQIEASVKVCVFGKCKKWNVIIQIPEISDADGSFSVTA